MKAGPILKMKTSYSQGDGPVMYSLPVGDQYVEMNTYLGKNLKITFTGVITCIHCDRKIKKTFSGGFCFPCSQKLACADMCIVKPELCHFHKGTCREPEWGEKNCMIEHTIYLSNSSGLKVGITRAHQRLTRWIDQGANQAIALASVYTRKDAGVIEVMLKELASDKTNWRKMLKNDVAPINLLDQREEFLAHFPEELEWEESEDDPVEIEYPVNSYPEKVKSHNFDKESVLEGELTGIKGQYLMFGDVVVNMRKYAGYHMEIS